MIQLISGNLNQWGNGGNFETDRSAWGFADTWNGADGTVITRTLEDSTKDLASSRTSITGQLPFVSVGRVTLLPNKKYIFRANLQHIPQVVIVGGNPFDLPIGTDDMQLGFFLTASHLLDLTVVENISTTLLACKRVWQLIELRVETGVSLIDPNVQMSIQKLAGSPGNWSNNPNAGMLTDQFEIYEYIDVADPSPPCDLVLNIIVDPPSSPIATDGSMTVTTAGSGATLEFSNNNGASWQLSNIFAGIGIGIYLIKVREQATPLCITPASEVVVNADPVDFDFTTQVTNESVAGAQDGQIAVTPSGPGAPFTYSKDFGAVFQASNLFLNLAAAAYGIVVKSDAGLLLLKEVTVNAGAQSFNKSFFSKNFITLEKQAVANWQLLDNYRLFTQVRVEDVADSEVYSTKISIQLTPDASGQGIFHLQEAFRDVFDLSPPQMNTTVMQRITGRIKRFITLSGDLEGDEVIPLILDPSLPSLVLHGGLDKQSFPKVDFFGSFISTNKKFLSWAPLAKTIDRQQEDYLTYFNFSNTGVLKISAMVYFDDGTSLVSVLQTIIVEKGHLVQIPAGANLGVQLIDPAKTVVKYTLQLLNAIDQPVSEVRTYVYAPVRHPRTRFFLFLNSLGGYEVLRFTGQATTDTSFSRKIIQKHLQTGYKSQEGEFENNVNNSTQKTVYSTGFLTRDWLDYMKDFLHSTRVFDVTTGQRIPVTITSSTHQVEDQNYALAMQFEAQNAYQNEVYTPTVL